MAGRRLLRVARVIREVASRIIIYELTDPRMGFVTVTEVEVSADLHNATVKLSVMGDEKQERLTMAAVQHASKKIQGELFSELQMKVVPRLRFELDERVKKSVEISRLIAKAAAEYRNPDESGSDVSAEAEPEESPGRQGEAGGESGESGDNEEDEAQ